MLSLYFLVLLNYFEVGQYYPQQSNHILLHLELKSNLFLLVLRVLEIDSI